MSRSKVFPPFWEAPLILLLDLIPEIKELFRPGGDLELERGLFFRALGTGDFAIAFDGPVELRFELFFLVPIGFKLLLGELASPLWDFSLRGSGLLCWQRTLRRCWRHTLRHTLRRCWRHTLRHALRRCWRHTLRLCLRHTWR